MIGMKVMAMQNCNDLYKYVEKYSLRLNNDLNKVIRKLRVGLTIVSLQDQLTDEINRKLANKVMINVGLCLSLHDILEVGESFLFPGNTF